jgi:hypothetical protein
LPLSFEIFSRGSGYSLFLTGNEAVLSERKPGNAE